EQLWEMLQSEVSAPTMLTPHLLDETARLVANDVQLSEAVKAMRIVAADRQAQAELAEAAKKTGRLSGNAPASFWMDALGRHWFCVLSPDKIPWSTTGSNQQASVKM